MATETLGTLRSRVRLRLRDPNTVLWTDAELNRWINLACIDLQEKTEWMEDFYFQYITSGISDYYRPSDKVQNMRWQEFDRYRMNTVDIYELDRKKFDWRTDQPNNVPIRLYKKDWNLDTFYPTPNLNGDQVTFTQETGVPVAFYQSLGGTPSTQVSCTSAPASGSVLQAWYSNTAINGYIAEVPAGIVNGVNTVFNLSNSPRGPFQTFLRLFLNGLRMSPFVDYTLVGPTVTFTNPPESGAVLLASYYTVPTSWAAPEVPAGAINGSNTAFTLLNTPNPSASLFLTSNGRLLKGGGLDFTIANQVITFVTAPSTGTVLLADYRTAGSGTNYIDSETPTGVINGINVNFTTAVSPAYDILFFDNGLCFSVPGDYLVTSTLGNTVIQGPFSAELGTDCLWYLSDGTEYGQQIRQKIADPNSAETGTSGLVGSPYNNMIDVMSRYPDPLVNDGDIIPHPLWTHYAFEDYAIAKAYEKEGDGKNPKMAQAHMDIYEKFWLPWIHRMMERRTPDHPVMWKGQRPGRAYASRLSRMTPWQIGGMTSGSGYWGGMGG